MVVYVEGNFDKSLNTILLKLVVEEKLVSPKMSLK